MEDTAVVTNVSLPRAFLFMVFFATSKEHIDLVWSYCTRLHPSGGTVLRLNQ